MFWIRIRSDLKLLTRSGNHFVSAAAAFFPSEKLVQVCKKKHCSLVVLDPDPGGPRKNHFRSGQLWIRIEFKIENALTNWQNLTIFQQMLKGKLYV